MAISVRMGLARLSETGDSWTDEMFDVQQIGLYGRYSGANSGFSLGITVERIVRDKQLDFIKINDPIITQRLRRAFISKKKFRNLRVIIREGENAYEFDFENIRVPSFKQQFWATAVDSVSIPFLMDYVTVQAESVFAWQ